MLTVSTVGAYILSPLEEASRDPTQNAGFSVTWLNTDLVSSRTTSYSYRNNPVDISPKSDNAVSSHVDERRKLTSGGANHVGNRLLTMMHSRATSKSGISGSRTGSNDTSFAAFKALPVGCTHVRNGSRYTEPADDLASATSCKEAVDLIVDAIKGACEEIGSPSEDDFISEQDIVRLVCQNRAVIVPRTQCVTLACQRHSVRRASMQRWSTA